MSLVIQCPTCQTQLSVDESVSGQQVQCPNCNTVLQVGPVPPSAATAAKPRPPASSTAPRTQPKPAASKSAAGVKKPAPARTPPSTEVVDWPNNDAVETPRPHGSGSRFFSFLLVFVVGLGGGGAAAYFGFPYVFKSESGSSPSTKGPESGPKPPPDDLVFMPDQCQILASVTVPKLLTSAVYKDECRREGISLEKHDIAAVFRLTGVVPGEIERLTFGAVETEGTEQTKQTEWVLVIRSSNPPRVDELKTATGEYDPQPVTIGKQTIYLAAFGGALFFPVERERTVVLASSASVLKSVINRDGPTQLPEGLKTAYQPLNDSWGIWVGIDATAAPTPAAGSPSAVPGLDAALLKSIEAVVVESPADKPADFQVVVRCKDETAAGTLRDKLNDLLGKIPPLPPANPLSIFNSVRFETVDKRIAARMSVRPEWLLKPLADLRWETPEYWIATLADKSDANKANRDRARQFLSVNPQRSIPFLVRALQNDSMITDALIELGEMKEKGKSAAPAVARLMTHPLTGPRLEAVKTLAAFGPQAKKDVLAALLQAESDSDDNVRLAARRARPTRPARPRGRGSDCGRLQERQCRRPCPRLGPPGVGRVGAGRADAGADSSRHAEGQGQGTAYGVHPYPQQGRGQAARNRVPGFRDGSQRRRAGCEGRRRREPRDVRRADGEGVCPAPRAVQGGERAAVCDGDFREAACQSRPRSRQGRLCGAARRAHSCG